MKASWTRPRASRRASARPGSSARADALGRTQVPASLGTLLRGVPEGGSAWDLALVEDRSQLEDASAWSARSGGQLVLSEEAIHCIGAEGHAPVGAAGAVAAIWCEDAEGEAWNSFAPPMAGRDSTLASSSPMRTAPAQAPLAGPIPLLHPALAMALHELCHTDVARAHESERQLARWIETSLLPACRSVGLERPALERAAVGIGGWIRSDGARSRARRSWSSGVN